MANDCPVSSNLQRLAIACEDNEALPTSEFCTPITDMTRFLDVPAISGSLSLGLNREQISTQIISSVLDAGSSIAFRPFKPTLSFTVNMGLPDNGGAGDGVTPCTGDDSFMLRLLFGMYGTYAPASATATGSTAVSMTAGGILEVADATGFQPGMAIGWVNPDGEFETCLIEAIDPSGVGATNDLQLSAPLSATPAAGDPIYLSATFCSNECPPCSFQMLWEGKTDNIRYRLMGGQITGAPTITRTRNEILQMTFNMTFAGFEQVPDPSPFTAVETYPKAAAKTVTGCFYVEDLASTPAVREEYPAGTVGYNLTSPIFQEVTGGCGDKSAGIARWARSATEPNTVTVSLPDCHFDPWFERFMSSEADGNRWKIWDNLGAGPGCNFVVEMSAAQLVGFEHVDEGGLAYIQLTFRAGPDTRTTPNTTNLARCAFRIHQL